MKKQSEELSTWLDTKIIIHPEVVEACIRSGIEDVLLLWMIAKAVDTNFGKSTGLIAHYKLLRLCNDLFIYSDKSKQAYNKISKGIGKLWTKPSGEYGDKILGLYSKKKVYDSLNISTPPVKPFVISANDMLHQYNRNSSVFSPGLSTLKSFLMGLVASRHADGRPLTLWSLQKSTGLSRSTVRRRISGCTGVDKSASYVSVDECSSRYQGFETLQKFNSHNSKHFLVDSGGAIKIVRRTGNVYTFAEIERAAKKSRPKELKLYDLRTLANIEKRKYVLAVKQINLATTASEYFVAGGYGKKMQGEENYYWEGFRSNTEVVEQIIIT